MATRNLEEARRAYELGDIEASRRAHSTPSPEKHKRGGEYIKSLVYGGMDGIITTFSIVAGATGSELGTGVVIILGLSNVLADGLSMAFGDYLSTKSEVEYRNAEKARETWEVENNPEGEMQEMEELYIAKGIPQEDAKLMVNALVKNKDAWINVMMVEELGLLDGDESPVKNALVTFFSFIIMGIFPLIPFLIGHWVHGDIHILFYASIGLTALSLFFLGAAKTKFTSIHPIKSGIETLIVGGIAAGAAFLIGYVLEPLTNDD